MLEKLVQAVGFKIRSDSSEKRTASPSNATLSWVSDTSICFSDINMVAAAIPVRKHKDKDKAHQPKGKSSVMNDI